jgi:putative flippase GtrA
LRPGTRFASPAGVSPPLVRSALVGAVATAVDLLALALLVQVAGLEPAAANVPALLAGVAVQFAGNKWFAFRDPSPRLVRQSAQFAAVEVGALALNALGFHLLVVATPTPYPVARALASAAVYFAYSYPLWGRIFGARR